MKAVRQGAPLALKNPSNGALMAHNGAAKNPAKVELRHSAPFTRLKAEVNGAIGMAHLTLTEAA